MQNTPETKRLRANVLDWLAEQNLDTRSRAAQEAEVQEMNAAELLTNFTCLRVE
jgi:hypothetical protein